nr:four helix bundle protein [Brasilonema octagenarum]
MNSLVYEKAYKFAIRIVNAYKYLTQDKKEFILSKQLIRSGTSIGANIAEAELYHQQNFLQKILLLTKNVLKVSIGCPF